VGDMSGRVNVGSYFEAQLQLRPKREDMLNFVLKKVTPVKVVEYKYGFDVFLKKKEEAFRLASELKEKFKGSVKKSRTLYGGGQGRKMIYRYTYLVRLEEEQK